MGDAGKFLAPSIINARGMTMIVTAAVPTSAVTLGRSANGRITSRQLSAIFAIARERKMSNGDVRDLAKEMFSKNIDYLAKSEASSLIDHLLAQ